MSGDGLGEKRSVLVIGAGESTGGAIAKRFAREGLVAVCVRRSADQLAPLVEEIEAEAYWQLHAQPRNAWSFELDLRPFDERW